MWRGPPAFAIVTLINFILNRAFTFRASEGRGSPLWRAMRSSALAVSWSIMRSMPLASLSPRRSAFATSSPVVLTLFIAAGTATATIVTFAGFSRLRFQEIALALIGVLVMIRLAFRQGAAA